MFPHKHFCLQFKMITEMTPLKQKPRQIRPHSSNNLLNFSTDMAHSISAVFSNLNILQVLHSPFPSIIDLPQKEKTNTFTDWVICAEISFFLFLDVSQTGHIRQTASCWVTIFRKCLTIKHIFHHFSYSTCLFSATLLKQYFGPSLFFVFLILRFVSYPYDCSVILLISPPPLSFSLPLCLSLFTKLLEWGGEKPQSMNH